MCRKHKYPEPVFSLSFQGYCRSIVVQHGGRMEEDHGATSGAGKLSQCGSSQKNIPKGPLDAGYRTFQPQMIHIFAN